MLRREAREAGVVAIVVALSISTFLLGFAALAVDLGSAYARQSQLESVAQQVAMAGAQELPNIANALTEVDTALAQVCAGEGDLTGLCPPPPNWKRNGTLTDGEVQFYADTGQSGTFADLTGDGKLEANDFLAYSAVEAAGIRVVLPPSRVEFGLASAIGFSGVDVSRAATARIGTPLGMGILPFALTDADLAAGQFCVKDRTVSGGGSAPPASGRFVWLSPASQDVPGDGTPQTIRITLTAAFFGSFRASSLVFHSTNSSDTLEADPVPPGPGIPANTWDVILPGSAAGTTAQVWVTGRVNIFFRDFPFTSQAALVRYTGTVPPRSDLCDQPLATNRGYTDIARAGLGSSQWLEANVRQSPETKLYPADSEIGSTLSSTLDCVSDLVTASTGCLTPDTTDSFGTQVGAGLLTASGNQPGRMTTDCGQGRVAARDTAGTQVDASRLISGASSPLLDQGRPAGLRDRILNHGLDAAQDGWAGAISSRALRCSRMAVLPVVSPVSVSGGQQIEKFVYVWIDDVGRPQSRGLNFAGGKLSSVRGYVIEPGLLPTEVAGSPLVGPYLGDDMPKQVVLVHDLGSPGT